jgi:predicted kinase
MNTWYRESQQKILYIMRGLSGSGKSTLANQLGEEGVVVSTDDYFMENGEYKFDPDKLREAHAWAQNQIEEVMQRGISPIVADNTNVKAWEMKPIVQLALKYGYKVEVREPTTPWKFDPVELAKRNKHGVPQEKIEEKIEEWDTDISLENILQSKMPWEDTTDEESQ